MVYYLIENRQIQNISNLFFCEYDKGIEIGFRVARAELDDYSTSTGTYVGKIKIGESTIALTHFADAEYHYFKGKMIEINMTGSFVMTVQITNTDYCYNTRPAVIPIYSTTDDDIAGYTNLRDVTEELANQIIQLQQDIEELANELQSNIDTVNNALGDVVDAVTVFE